MESPLSLFHVLGCLAAVIVALSLKNYYQSDKSGFFTSIAVVGIRPEWFTWLRATVRSLWATQGWAFDGYERFSKNNIPFVIPSIDRGPLVVIPPRQIKKIYDLPESILNVHDTQNETLQVKWTIWDDEVGVNNFQIKVIRNQLTRNLEVLTPMIAGELSWGFERFWGTDTNEWKPIRIWDSALKLIAGAANGAFCGAPLCRNDKFLKDLRDHAMSIFAGAIVINSTPKILKPVTGTLVGWTTWFLFEKTLKTCLPFVKERLAETAKLKADPSYNWTPPKDALQWIIDECYLTENPAQLDPKRVSHRLLLVNDISLHSTAFTVQNVILDLFSQDPSLGFVEALREQCKTVLAEAGGSWTRDAVRKLTLVDSTIRESMRLSPFGTIGLPRTVVHPDGIKLDNTDVTVPQGTVFAVPMEPVHYDEDIYPDARKFNAFRFAQPSAVKNVFDSFTSKEDIEAARLSEANGDPKKPKSSVSLDDAFLGFGFGKYACPGRFFALNEMKIFMAHMLLNYDVEYLKVRPQHMNIISLKLPLNKGTIRVRRRVGTEGN